MTSARGISFELRPSATLTRLLVLIVVLSAVAPLLTSLPWTLRWLLAAGVGASGVRRVRAFRQPAMRRLVWAADGVWSVTDHRGRTFVAELTGFRPLGSAVFLSLRWPRGAGHVALLPDNTEPDDFRVLRARLGWNS